MSHCSIKPLEDGETFQTFPNLERLDFGSNNISSLNSTIFKSLTKLWWLNMKNNGILNLDKVIFTDLVNKSNK